MVLVAYVSIEPFDNGFGIPGHFVEGYDLVF